jgi:hypothetical protein
MAANFLKINASTTIGIAFGTSIGAYGIYTAKRDANEQTGLYYAGLSGHAEYVRALVQNREAMADTVKNVLIQAVLANSLDGAAHPKGRQFTFTAESALGKLDRQLQLMPEGPARAALADTFMERLRAALQADLKMSRADIAKLSNRDLIELAQLSSEMGHSAVYGPLRRALALCGASKACQQQAMDRFMGLEPPPLDPAAPPLQNAGHDLPPPPPISSTGQVAPHAYSNTDPQALPQPKEPSSLSGSKTPDFWKKGPPAKLDSGDVSTGNLVRPCCNEVAPGQSVPIDDAYHPAYDPYYASRGFHRPGTSASYGYKAPSVLRSLPPTAEQATAAANAARNGRFIPVTVKFGSSGTGMVERLADAVQGSSHPNYTVMLAGSGATSDAFFLYPPPSSGNISNAAQKLWAWEKAVEVIKVRKASPWGSGLEAGVDMMRRDLAMYGLANELTAGATYEGKPMIRVARILSTERDHAKGIIRQEAVHGPSVFELQNAINCIGLGAICPAGTMQTARDVLIRAGFSENGVVTAAKAIEAQDRIRALEQFYRDTHNDVIAFENANGLKKMGNRLRTGTTVSVGFDFNHGSNVFWDPATKMFVMIDW